VFSENGAGCAATIDIGAEFGVRKFNDVEILRIHQGRDSIGYARGGESRGRGGKEPPRVRIEFRVRGKVLDNDMFAPWLAGQALFGIIRAFLNTICETSQQRDRRRVAPAPR